MLKIGDRIKYKDITGEVKAVMNDMVIAKLEDGIEYSLPYDAVTLDGSAVMSPGDFSGLIQALKPHIKNVNFLNDLAKVMHESGVSNLNIQNGAIQSFNAKESLEEKIARYKAEALSAAEKKAREEFEQESARS